MDKLKFGINFLRNGRYILFQDQSIFSFSDPATGETYKDYPVEWPADQGRIVGEVHCDHVRVDFIKREFDGNDPYWKGVVEIVRGTTSLQPKRHKGATPNVSPLATIFSAFRINEPGTRYLIPGNGTRAIHEATRNWGSKFREGENDYLTDKKWYQAAAAHDKIASGSSAESTSVTDSKDSNTPLTTPILSPEESKTPSPNTKDSISTLKSETINQKPIQ